MDFSFEELPLEDRLTSKIRDYFNTIWRDKYTDNLSENWVANFNTKKIVEDVQVEQLNMLYLLTKFIYFGDVEVRSLLKAIYRDLFRYPFIKSIRIANDHSLDPLIIEKEFKKILNVTRFIGLGGAAGSGTHLMYLFRQENSLNQGCFMDEQQIFKEVKTIHRDESGLSETFEFVLSNPEIQYYVFIDDFCGTGEQASKTLGEIVDRIKSINKEIEIYYFLIFATEVGIKKISEMKGISKVESVFAVDDSFKAFSENSRYFKEKYLDNTCIDKVKSRSIAVDYGLKLYKDHCIGYKNCQLMVGFKHNTPDNTLPIFWSIANNWVPIFQRYNKQ